MSISRDWINRTALIILWWNHWKKRKCPPSSDTEKDLAIPLTYVLPRQGVLGCIMCVLQTAPNLPWCKLQFFDSTVVRKEYTESRNRTLSDGSDLILSGAGKLWSRPLPRCWAVASAPRQPRDHEGRTTDTLTWPFCLSLSVQQSVNYME